MPKVVAFVEEPGTAKIDRRRKLVTITYSSGGEQFIRTMALEDYRAFISDGVRLLNEYDAAERSRVVDHPTRNRARGKAKH